MSATRSCLGSEELQGVARAGLGPLAPDVAAHLAGCGVCQTRLLAFDLPVRPSAPKPKARFGSALIRPLLLLLMILAALASMLMFVR